MFIKFHVFSLSFLLCYIVPLSVLAQGREIQETITNDFVLKNGKPQNMGVQNLAPKVYRDSLIRYFDKIEEYYPELNDTTIFRFYHAVFGNDTLSYKERKKEIFRSNGKNRLLEVESNVYPYQRFVTEIDGLTIVEIDSLKGEMSQRKTNDILLNNSQTCIFYAINLLLDMEGISPEPIISRNTTFTNGYQLNAFFDHLLALQDSYPCKFKVLKKAELPDRCILVFRNANNEFIHAMFYRKDTGEYYSKNGLFSPIVTKDMHLFTTQYGRYDTKQKDLTQDALDRLADTVLVYTIN